MPEPAHLRSMTSTLMRPSAAAPAPTRTVLGSGAFAQIIGSSDPHDIEPEQRVLHVVLDCGHRKNYTERIQHLPRIGEDHACWSACDRIGAVTRRVIKIEWGDTRYGG